MKRDKRGRTEKVFVDYNDYRDRPFGYNLATNNEYVRMCKIVKCQKPFK